MDWSPPWWRWSSGNLGTGQQGAAGKAVLAPAWETTCEPKRFRKYLRWTRGCKKRQKPFQPLASLDVLSNSAQTLTPLFPLVFPLNRWVFVYEKGYQTSSGLISSVSVKLKGLAVTQLQGLGPQVWDVADYVFPAHVSGTILPPISPGLRLFEGPVQLPALWASVCLTVRLHHDTMGCGVCWVLGGLQRPSGVVSYQFSLSPLCPSLPGGQLLCSYDQFHHDPSAGSRTLCRGEDPTLLDPQGR